MSPTVDDLALRLQQIICGYWRIPKPEDRMFLSVLLRSSCSRVVLLRQHLSLAQTLYPTAQGIAEYNLDALFADTITPHFMVALLGDLRATRSLSSEQAAVIEEALLSTVSRDGAWRPREEESDGRP